MSAPAERYTDRDLRRDPRLLGIAICYARDYDGEFEPMLDARDEAIRNGTLPLPMARTVLNCMRHDFEAQEMLPARPTRPTLRVVQDAEDNRKAHPSQVRRDEPERTYILRTEVQVKYNYGFVKGRYPNKVLHFVADAYCQWEKYDYNKRCWRKEAIPRFVVTWACGGHVQDPILVPSDDELPAGGYCRSGCWETERLTELINGRWVEPRE